MDEADLISRAREGDEAAYESLMQQHQQAVFRLAYLILGDAGDAEDTAQETFIQAFAALNRFDTTRPLRPWLLRITTNLAYNRRRAMGRYLRAVQRFIRALPPEAIRDEAPDRSDAQAVWESVRQLSQADQEIIYLRYFLELSESEAAEALGIAQGTVKSRLHRALERLRTVINKEGLLLWEGGRQ